MTENMNFKDMFKNANMKKAEEQPAAETPKPTVETPKPAAEIRIDVCNGEDVRMVDPTRGAIVALENRIADLEAMIISMRDNPPCPDMSAFLTTREQIKSLNTAIERENIEITNKSLIASMEQISIMREDFFKLCSGMREKLDSMKAEDVLASFEAYQVDMENILKDAGVFIGHFEYDKLNTIHQRLVEVIPTNDMSKNGMIAERLSDGYKIGNRVLFKEKVSVYRYTELAEETVSVEPEAEDKPVQEETVSKEPETEQPLAQEPTEAATEETSEAVEEKPKPKRKRKTTKTVEEAE